MGPSTLTQLFGLLHDVIAKPVCGLEGLLRRGRLLGRGRWGEKRKHGGPVAHHANLAALVGDAAREVVGAPLVVARVADALNLDRLREGVPCGMRCGAAVAEGCFNSCAERCRRHGNPHAYRLVGNFCGDAPTAAATIGTIRLWL